MKDMNKTQMKNQKHNNNTLVLGGNGKTGRRVVERLKAIDVPVRVGSRTADLPFDWQDQNTWQAILLDIKKVYISFYPDLAVPGAADAIRAFTDLAVQSGVERLILLSGRGEEEAQACEKIVQQAGAEWTILRASWFCQNFSEGFMRDLVLGGVLAFPAGNIKEPFIDADDIADVAVAALTEDGHSGEIYEMTGPRLLAFADVVQEIAKATGRDIRYIQISHEDFASGLEQQGVPKDMVSLLDYLFGTVLDGRNEHLNDGVQRALGRNPRDFSEYVRDAASAGAW